MTPGLYRIRFAPGSPGSFRKKRYDKRTKKATWEEVRVLETKGELTKRSKATGRQHLHIEADLWRSEQNLDHVQEWELIHAYR